MKTSKLMAFTLLFFLLAGQILAATQEVSQAAYATDNGSYDRNPSVIFDGASYWLFYTKGDNTSTGGVRDGSYNPDADSYVVYYKTASTIPGLTAASETKLDLSESARPANFSQRVVSATVFDGDIYAFVSSGQDGTDRGLYYYQYDGMSWSGPVQLIADATARGGHVNVTSDVDRVYIVWESSDGSSDCYTWNGTSLGNKVDISNGNQPKITLLSGTKGVGVLYVVNIEDGTGDIELFQGATDPQPAFGSHSTPIPGGGFYDPCVFHDGSNLYVVSAPYVAADRQYLVQTKSAGTSSTWAPAKTITYGGYGTTEWWDYWPCGLYDGSNAWIFFVTETDNGPNYSDGEIAFIEMDWTLADDHYLFIQNGIDQALSGDIVNVAPGHYQEAILINKPLTLLGATTGVNKNGYTVPADYAWDEEVETIISHPNPSGGYSAIVDIYDTDDVTFDGFIVQELGAVANLNTSLVRVYAHTRVISDINVINNVIGPNTNTVSQDGTHGRMGLYIINHPYSDNGVTNSTFAGNKIFDCKGNGDNIFLWSSYYAYGAPGPASMAGTVIEDNEIYGSHRSGIETAGGFADLAIRNNDIYGNSGLPSDDPDKLKFGHGILLIRGSSDKVSDPLTAFGPVDLTIEGNDIYDNEKSGIYMGPKNDGVSLINNYIHDNGWNGVMVDLVGNYWNPTYEDPPTSELYACYDCSSDISAFGNAIYNNGTASNPLAEFGAAVNGVPTNGFIFDASGNYWGTTSSSGVAGEVTAYVDYTPWLDDGTLTDPGFDGDLSVLWVDDDSPQSGTSGYVQEGIGMVEGSTVNVAAGTYNESIIFESGFAKDGILISGDVGDRPIIAGGIRFLQTAEIDGIGFENLYIKGMAPGANAIFDMDNGGAVNDFDMDNCVFDGENVSGRICFGGQNLSQSLAVTNTEFKDVLGWALMDIESGSGDGGSNLPFTTVVFADNHVHDCNGSISLRGLSTDRTDAVNVYGNIFENIGGNQSEQGQHWAAFEINHADVANIYENTVDNVSEGEWGEGQAAQLWDIGSIDMHDNTITNCFQGVFVFGGSLGGTYGGPYAIPGGSMYSNTFEGNSEYNVSVDGEATGPALVAENNFWGAITCEPVSSLINGNVDFDPWCNSDFSYCGFSCTLEEVWVDDDWSGYSPGDEVEPEKYFGYNAFDVIQDGIDAVNGSTINVAPGTYREQLYIDKSVDLLGSGSESCTIEAPDPGDRATYSITQWTGSVKTVDAVIGVNGAGTVNVDGFTIDGRDVGPNNFYGVHFFNTSGSVTNCVIDNITYSSNPGSSNIVSLIATHGLGETFSIDFSNNTVPIFQKGGIVIMGPGATFTVNGSNVSGVVSSSIAGNCIQLSYGASGSTSGNYVEGTTYTGTDWASTGILLFESGDISMNGDEVYNCESGVNFSDWGWIHDHPTPVNLNFSNLNLHGNTWTLGVQMSRDNSDVNLTVENSSILDNGGDGFDLWGTGVDPWGGSYYTGWSNGDLTATITGCTITNAVYDGIWTADLSGNTNNTAVIDVHGCYFTGNTSSAVNNTLTQTVDATACYWDDATGPTTGTKSGSLRQAAAMVSPFGDDLPQKGVILNTSYNPSRGSGETIFGTVDYSPFWTANYIGDPHTSAWTWGVDNSGTIADGIAAASSGDNIIVYPGTYAEGPQIVIDKELTIIGDDRSTVTITPTANTGSSGDTRGWFLVQPGCPFDISGVSFDGAGFDIYQAFRSYSDITFTSLDFINIGYSTYIGIACAIMDASIYADDCNLSNIQRVGFLMFGPSSNDNMVENCTYAGKGDGDWLDYAFEFGNGASGVVDNCEVFDNTGVASSDGSTSAGILATTYYGPGTAATITNCHIHDNTQGIGVGYDASDATTVIAHDNTIVNNPSGAIASTSTIETDAEGNYWGTLNCPEITAMMSGLVDFDPWCNSDFSYCGFTCLLLEVWADDDWAGSSEGDPVGGHIFGYDAFDVIADAVNAVSDNGIVHVLNGNYDVPVNIEGRANLSILGESQTGTIYKPSATIGWDIAPYGASRQVAIRVVGSTDITLSNMTMDFDIIKGDNKFGLLYWNSTGEISNNTLTNMNTSGYYEMISYLRAPDYSDIGRAQIDILNNTFLKTGRVGIVIHDYVNTLIEGNSFDKVDDDFGYAIELGSMATGIIRGNVFANYDTWAATDQSSVSAIYIENSFTNAITSPMSKPVTIEGNDIYHCQYGIFIGNEFPGYSGDVDIVATITDNTIHDNSTTGSLASGGIIIADEGKSSGSSVTAILDHNVINDNGDYGLFAYTDGNGDISVTVTDNIIADNYTGVSIKDYATTSTSSYSFTVHHNIFDNYLNAEDDVAGGYWDDGTTGNCWSDYETNSGYPIRYNVSGNAGTRDRHPNEDCSQFCDCEPGEADNTSPMNILDIVYLINHVYKSGPAPVPYGLCNGDPNCDCTINILDIVYLINTIYKDGPQPCECADWMFACKLPIRSEVTEKVVPDIKIIENVKEATTPATFK